MRHALAGVTYGLVGVLGLSEAAPPSDLPVGEYHTYFASTDPKVAAEKSGQGPRGDVLGRIKAGKDGAAEVHGLYLTPDLRRYPADARLSTIHYPPLREGDLIPGLRRQVCVVDRLTIPGRGGAFDVQLESVLKLGPWV